MSKEQQINPIETIQSRQNVKEKLNSLLHKKIQDCSENSEPPRRTDSIESNEFDIPDVSNEGKTDEDSVLDQHILHNILKEKKKELLRNPEVIQFLQNKPTTSVKYV